MSGEVESGAHRRRSALITGASRGLGKSIAALLAEDHHLFLGGRDPERLTEEAARYPSAEPFVADLSDDGELQKACLHVDELDVLVLNAAHADMRPIMQTDREQWRKTFEINLFGTVELVRRMIPVLRKSSGATIVFINSGLGRSTHPGKSVYSASKHALRAFSSTLRAEEQGNGIRVVSIHPGPIATDMQREMEVSRGLKYDEGRYLAAQAVAECVALAVRLPGNAVLEELSIRPLPVNSERNGSQNGI